MHEYSLADKKPEGEECKVGGKSLAFVCMFSLNYVSPKSDRAVKKEGNVHSVNNDLSLTSGIMDVLLLQKVSWAWLPELQLCALSPTGLNLKATFH